MRIKGKLDLVPFQSGKVDLVVDHIEDLWILYNILAKGDYIKTVMFRKVQHETGTGKTQSVKKKIIITIKIEEIDYDQTEGIIRLKGKNVSENEYISIGQFQTAEITKGSFFTLLKQYWDDISIDTLKTSTDPTLTSEVAAIMMEEGVAHLYLITNNQTVLQGKITQSIPKKRAGSTQHDKSKNNFFQKILNNLVKQINFNNIKCVIVASPGFTKDEFGDFLTDQVENNLKEYGSIKNNINKFIYTHSSSGYKQSLEEILSKPEIKKLIKDTKCVEDNVIMERFNEILGIDMDKAFFGLNAFNIAYEKNAIDTVMFTDSFLRKISLTNRKKFSKNIKDLKIKGTKVFKMSSQHVSGEKIDSFGGIVGILTYVVPEISDLGVDDLEIKENENEKNDEINENNEMLQNLIKDNNIKYNNEEDEKENENENEDEENNKNKNKKNEKKKRKKREGEKKEFDQNRKKNQRKKSSMDDEDDDYD